MNVACIRHGFVVDAPGADCEDVSDGRVRGGSFPPHWSMPRMCWPAFATRVAAPGDSMQRCSKRDLQLGATPIDSTPQRPSSTRFGECGPHPRAGVGASQAGLRLLRRRLQLVPEQGVKHPIPRQLAVVSGCGFERGSAARDSLSGYAARLCRQEARALLGDMVDLVVREVLKTPRPATGSVAGTEAPPAVSTLRGSESLGSLLASKESSLDARACQGPPRLSLGKYPLNMGGRRAREHETRGRVCKHAMTRTRGLRGSQGRERKDARLRERDVARTRCREDARTRERENPRTRGHEREDAQTRG